MPQKKNPDGAELVRGRTGRVYGDLMALLCAMKGLPLAYNKDMQQDKDSFADALDVVTASLMMMERMIGTLQAKPEAMEAAVKKGFLNATEVADYLVQHGVPFRDAHGIVGQIVIYCEDAQKGIEELSLDELLQFSPAFGPDIFSYIDYARLRNINSILAEIWKTKITKQLTTICMWVRTDSSIALRSQLL